MKTTITKTSCSCDKCKACCWSSMGWFGSIKEVEGAAKIMKMPVKQFAKEYLIREWWVGEDGYVPAPRKNFLRATEAKKRVDSEIMEMIGRDIYSDDKLKNGKGFVVATWGHNLMDGYACIFLTKNEKCAIHASKPRECREAFACKPITKKAQEIRLRIVKHWEKHQDFIELLEEN